MKSSRGTGTLLSMGCSHTPPSSRHRDSLGACSSWWIARQLLRVWVLKDFVNHWTCQTHRALHYPHLHAAWVSLTSPTYPPPPLSPFGLSSFALKFFFPVSLDCWHSCADRGVEGIPQCCCLMSCFDVQLMTKELFLSSLPSCLFHFSQSPAPHPGLFYHGTMVYLLLPLLRFHLN